MPRTEARLHFDIWVGLERVSADARLLYVVLLTDRSVNHAGVGSIRVDQWMRHSGLSMDRVEKAIVELGQEPHIVLDRHTGEFLIRTMIRRDNYESQPYLLKGALAVATNTESKTLRRVLARELRKLGPRRPDGVSKSGHPIVYPDPHGCADALEAGTGPDDDPDDGLPAGVPETLLSGSPDPVDTHSAPTPDPPSEKGSRQSVERLGGGGGGGGGGSPPVATHLQSKNGVARVQVHERARARAAEVAATSHSLAANQTVEGFAKRCAYRPARAVLTVLRPQVDELLANDWPHELIDRCLDAWAAKGLDARKFSSVAHEVANSGGPAGARPRRSTADTEIARLQALKTGSDGPSLRAIPGGEQ